MGIYCSPFGKWFSLRRYRCFLVIKININTDGISLTESFQQIENYQTFKIIALNLLPGAIIISLVHIMVYVPKFKYYFEKIQIKCC